ncbi:glycine oxidase ThiO [Dictyobacter formicarum]|uniref:glycine oxidase n=1 Tax=Dictyobacter formicarum TaxID=2778368 RepID=A0ABQ3VRS5_9CHLR|nr:glycine oxidase ThiO [Dictyobacter formicarum]GHO88031.1 glycine oxidase ThiO [Dictyobacter formicarum]
MVVEKYDVAIVGAGIVGCATAYYLTKAGIKVALLDKGSVAEEASRAAAGMLAPLGDENTDPTQPLERFYLTALQFHEHVEQEIQQFSDTHIGYSHTPTLRLAFDDETTVKWQKIMNIYKHVLPGLQWLDREEALQAEPLLSDQIRGALISPQEHNVQAPKLTQAYAQAVSRHGTRIFEGRNVGKLVVSENKVVGIETNQGPIATESVVLAAGAWTTAWHSQPSQAPVFPVKGQMIALSPLAHQHLRHTIYYSGMGCIVPKADGSICVGSTSETGIFDKSVTVEGITRLTETVQKLTPSLGSARFERAWAGIRPGSRDDVPLIGPSKSINGLWIASGLYRDGILLGPLVGHLIAEQLQQHVTPFDLDLSIFDPDRFGEWRGSVAD